MKTRAPAKPAPALGGIASDALGGPPFYCLASFDQGVQPALCGGLADTSAWTWLLALAATAMDALAAVSRSPLAEG